jgi:hypothetical protein
VAKLEGLPTPMWIALAVLGFVFWWPLGLAVLSYQLWSGRMMCCEFSFGRWAGNGNHTTGNQAFDDYRADTLRRLEEEQRAFQDFLSRLRMAKDKAEFDQFMTERTSRT